MKTLTLKASTGGKETLTKLLTISYLAFVGITSAPAAFVHDSGTEFTSSGDFNADGFTDVAVVTRDTGLYRIGYGTEDGFFNWGQPQPSGVVNIAAVATGKVNSTSADSLFFASTESNRITYSTPSSLTYNFNTDFLVSGVGPKILAALDIAGGSPANTAHLDLVTGSVLNNGAQTSSLRSYRSTGNNAITLLGSAGSTDQWIRAMAIKPNTAAAEQVLVQRRTGGVGSTEAFTLYTVTSGTPSASVVTATGLTSGSRLAYGAFDATQTDIFAYVAGSPTVVARRINASVNGFSSTINRTLPNGVEQLYVINNGSGNQVLVLHSNGSAVVYSYTLAGGFVAVATLPLTGAPGVSSGVTVTGNGAFQLLFSATAGQPSSQLWRYTASGGVWAKQGSEMLPKAGAFTGLSNVLYLNTQPFVTASPQVLRRTSVGDWTNQVTLSGAPQSATATWLDDLGASAGLGSSASQLLGTTPVGTQSVLYNQWRPSISLFWLEGQTGAVNEEVLATPAAGSYSQSITVSLASRSSVSSIWYRTNPNASFTLYGGSFVLYGDATVEMYAINNGAPSAIQKVDYHFTATPDKLDADSDGVPDFVERSLSLNPSAGADTDGDGFSDLEEILAGTSASAAGSKPAKHDDSAARFDLTATVVGHNGITNASAAPDNDQELTLHDVDQARLGSGLTKGGIGQVQATAQPVESTLRLLTMSTAANFPLAGVTPDPDLGRELVGLIAVPDGVQTTVPFTYDFASAGTQSAAWIAAAQAAYASVSPASVTTTLDINDTLITALFEWGLTGTARARGLLQENEQLCFTKWRALDEIDNDLTALSPDELRSLETPSSATAATSEPCVLIRESLTALIAQVMGSNGAALRSVAQDIYRISSALGNASPGLYAAPLDAIRSFIWTGAMPESYGLQSVLSRPTLQTARSSISTMVANAIVARPLTTLTVSPAMTPVNGATAVDVVPSGPRYALLDELGQPFELPETFSLPAGSAMTVIGYTDRPQSVGLATIEVVSVIITQLGAPSPSDTDGNLLPDAWELAFFGAIGQDPLTSGDGSAYSRLQEYFEGTDPGSSSDSPSVAPQSIGITNVRIADHPENGSVELRFDFPSAYANRVKANFLASTTLSAWAALPEATPTAGGFAHQTDRSGDRKFYRATVTLR